MSSDSRVDLVKLNSCSLILSHQFTFFIGKEGKPVVVHAAALAATSQQLNALINGGMKESEKQCARLEDVEVDDFIRFCEYAYRGDYAVPSSEEFASLTSGSTQQEDVDDSWGFGPLPKRGKKKKGKRAAQPPFDEMGWPTEVSDIPPEATPFEEIPSEVIPEPQSDPQLTSRAPLRAKFSSRIFPQGADPKNLILQRFEPKSNRTRHQNFTPVLLAHARLYCFAHVRLIAPLKALTLEKLHKTLLSFTLYEGRVGDIIELARYAYSNPDLPDRGDDYSLDDLRKLVLDYIVCEIDTIGKSDEFFKYMEEGGEFVGDFWRLAKEYMV